METLLSHWVAERRLRMAALAALLAAGTCVAAAGAAGAQGSNAPPTSQAFLGSRLVAPKPAASCAPHIGAMYRASAIVTGTDMRQRPWGFAQTLREVLVKASGDPRLRRDRRVAELAAHADRLVSCFAYVDMMATVPLHDDQGTYDRPYKLTVYFDPARIDAVLAQLGERPWRGARPVVVPVLLVVGPKLPPYVLSAENPAGAEQRGSFATAASRFGMKFRIPSEAELSAWGVTIDHFPATSPAGKTPDEAVVIGRLEWSRTLPGWVGAWRARWHGADYAWGISGVNYDAAFRDIVRGVEQLASGHGTPD
jgi:uncharacterized protein